MHWLNIKITTLRESEYISASPTQQATWLKLLAYCAQQENGGVIKGAGDWNDRAFLFGCGVTTEEVCSECGLWWFDESGDLFVWNYPVEKELEVSAKREAGRRGGMTKAQNRSTACSSATAQPVAQLVAESDSASTKKEEELEKEWKQEKEQEFFAPDSESAIPAPGPEETLFLLEKSVEPSKSKRTKRPRETADIPESEDAVIQHGQTLTPPLPILECRKFFSYWEGEKWRRRNGPVRSWKQSLVTWQLNWIGRNPQIELPKVSSDDPRYVEITEKIGEKYEDIVQMPFVSSDEFRCKLQAFLATWHGSADLFLSVYGKALEFRDQQFASKEIRSASDPIYLCDNFAKVVAAVDWMQANIDRNSKPKTFTKGI